MKKRMLPYYYLIWVEISSPYSTSNYCQGKGLLITPTQGWEFKLPPWTTHWSGVPHCLPHIASTESTKGKEGAYWPLSSVESPDWTSTTSLTKVPQRAEEGLPHYYLVGVPQVVLPILMWNGAVTAFWRKSLFLTQPSLTPLQWVVGESHYSLGMVAV